MKIDCKYSVLWAVQLQCQCRLAVLVSKLYVSLHPWLIYICFLSYMGLQCFVFSRHKKWEWVDAVKITGDGLAVLGVCEIGIAVDVKVVRGVLA